MRVTGSGADEARLQKEAWRRRIWEEMTANGLKDGGLHWGRVAAAIRKSAFYRSARHVLVPPAVCFFQVRLNALLDRKYLTVPTPGMQKGLQHFDPRRLAPSDCVALARLRKPGKALTRGFYGSPLRPPIDLVLGEVLCAAADGGLIGDGRGRLDLSCAILRSLGWLDGRAAVLAVAAQRSIVTACPQEDHDVKAHGVVTADGLFRTRHEKPPEAEIHWEKLGVRQMRRNEALFFLASRDGVAFR